MAVRCKEMTERVKIIEDQEIETDIQVLRQVCLFW
jgi:hypothetical protein